MLGRFILLFLAASSTLILMSFFWSSPVAEVVFVVLAMAMPVALMALGAMRDGRLGGRAVPLAVLLVWLEGCAIAILLLDGGTVTQPWIGGLPLSAALQVYGLGVGSLLFVVLAYALTFEASGLTDEDLAALRRRAKEAEDIGNGAGAG